MEEPAFQRWIPVAKQVVRRTLGLRWKDILEIYSYIPTIPVAEAIALEARRAGPRALHLRSAKDSCALGRRDGPDVQDEADPSRRERRDHRRGGRPAGVRGDLPARRAGGGGDRPRLRGGRRPFHGPDLRDGPDDPWTLV